MQSQTTGRMRVQMPRPLAEAPSAPAPDRLEEGATLLIGGSWRDAAATYERFDPADLGRRTGTFAQASAEDVEAAYRAASEAQPGWAATPTPQRADALRRAA